MAGAYLDHAATTAMNPAALAAYVEQAAQLGNASSLHAAGRAARKVVEDAREIVAQCLGAHPSEIVFTSGGTEANNLAIQGIYRARRAAHSPGQAILTSAIEHHSVLDTARWLAAHEGATLVELPVDRVGVVDLAALEAALGETPGAVLVSVMWANNEIGTIEPISQVAELARRFSVPIHTDAVQAIGQISVDFAAAGVDAMTVSAHKLGGPIGIGALLLRRGVPLEPVQHGGGHELGRRSGTLDVPAISAFAVAVQQATADVAGRAGRLRELRDQLVAGVLAAIPAAVLVGPGLDQARLPSIASFLFPGCDGDALLYLLDQAGIAASAGAACTAGVGEPSHVLLALGIDEADARSTVRFSLGTTSTSPDVAELVAALPGIVEQARLR